MLPVVEPQVSEVGGLRTAQKSRNAALIVEVIVVGFGYLDVRGFIRVELPVELRFSTLVEGFRTVADGHLAV